MLRPRPHVCGYFLIHVMPYWSTVRWETGHAFYVIGLKNIRIHPSTRHRIRCLFIFSTLESGFICFWIRCRIRRIRVDGSCIRKEKVADTCGQFVWTEPGAGQKTPENFVSGSSTKKWRHIRFKLRRAARFTKWKNGVSLGEDFPLFSNHQVRVLSFWG